MRTLLQRRLFICASAQNILKLSAGTEGETRINCILVAENCRSPQRANMTRQISIGRLVLALAAALFLNILLQHGDVRAVVPAVIFLFFLLLYSIQALVRALLHVLAWPFGFVFLIALWWN